jgi:uncharacterized protein (TIGR03437 family)
MKGSRTLVLLAAASLAQVALAQPAQLSLPDVSVSPGASLVLPVTFASRLSSVAGVQFDFQYDSSVLTLTATVGDAARSSAKILSVADLAPNQRRFFVWGLNQNPLVDGVLLNLFLFVSPSAPGGISTLRFSNVLGTDPYGLSTIVLATGGVLTVAGTVDLGSRLQPEGVLNAAGLFSGPVAPGEMVTLLGAGIGPALPQQPAGSPTSTVLDGTSVLFAGTPAPLLYGAPNQLNAIAPYGLYEHTSAQVLVTQRGQAVAGLILPVTDAAPAIFTQDGSSVGQGAIVNQDQALNSPSNPASKGSVISLFATGTGQTDPPGVDGQIATGTLPRPLLPVSVQVGGVDAKVIYVGAAPMAVAGLVQVNCMVPLTSPSGLAVPIVLFAGQAASQAGVTLAIR